MERAAALTTTSALPLSALLLAAADDGNDARLGQLIARLMADPGEHIRIAAFEALVTCQAWHGCRPTPAVVSTLATTVLADARLSAGGERRVAEWLAVYYLRVLADADAAVRILRSLADAAPHDLALQTRLAEALAAAGEPVQAAERAERVYRTLPWTSVMTDRVLRRRLERLVAAGESDA
jgi:hypothetical protein